MTSRSRFIAITSILVSALLVPLLAQGPTAVPAAAKGAQELAKAWSALAGGRAADAERASDALLKTAPRNHDALALKVRARLAGPGVSAALDTYEAWLPNVRQREDVSLLETIATNLVESLAAAPEGSDNRGPRARPRNPGATRRSQRHRALELDGCNQWHCPE